MADEPLPFPRDRRLHPVLGEYDINKTVVIFISGTKWTWVARYGLSRLQKHAGAPPRARDGIGTEEAWLTNITTCHTSKSGVCCLLINGGFSTTNGPRHATYGHRRDRRSHSPIFPQNLSTHPQSPSATIAAAVGHKSVHFWPRHCCDFDLKQYLVRWSPRSHRQVFIRSGWT